MLQCGVADGGACGGVCGARVAAATLRACTLCWPAILLLWAGGHSHAPVLASGAVPVSWCTARGSAPPCSPRASRPGAHPAALQPATPQRSSPPPGERSGGLRVASPPADRHCCGMQASRALNPRVPPCPLPPRLQRRPRIVRCPGGGLLPFGRRHRMRTPAAARPSSVAACLCARAAAGRGARAGPGDCRLPPPPESRLRAGPAAGIWPTRRPTATASPTQGAAGSQHAGSSAERVPAASACASGAAPGSGGSRAALLRWPGACARQHLPAHSRQGSPSPARAGFQSSDCGGLRLYLTNPRLTEPGKTACPAVGPFGDTNGVVLSGTATCSAFIDIPDTYDLSTSSAADTVLINQLAYGRAVRRHQGMRQLRQLRGAAAPAQRCRCAEGRVAAVGAGRCVAHHVLSAPPPDARST